MKRFATAIGIAAMLLVPAAAYAVCTYTWTGDTSQYWSNGANWDGDACTNYPGYDPTDAATIESRSGSDWPALNCDPNIASLWMYNSPTITTTSHKLSVSGEFLVGYSTATSYVEHLGSGEIEVCWMDIDARLADAASEDVTMEHSSGTLDVNGTTTLYASGSLNADAVLLFSGGTLELTDLDMRGGTHNSAFDDRGTAIAHFDYSPTIDQDIYATADVQIECDASVTADGLFVGSLDETSQTRKSGTQTLTVSTLIIQGGATDGVDTVLEVVSGAGSILVN